MPLPPRPHCLPTSTAPHQHSTSHRTHTPNATTPDSHSGGSATPQPPPATTQPQPSVTASTTTLSSTHAAHMADSSSRAAASGGRQQQGGAAAASSSTLGYYFAKLRQRDAATWEKDELLNVIYWWRQIAGVLLGLALGAAPVTGIMGVVMFFSTSLAGTASLYRNVLGIDEEAYGGHPDLIFEGLLGSFASFMVSWILTYTAVHANR